MAGTKDLYETLTVEVVELKSEGIVCGSGDTEDYFRNNPANLQVSKMGSTSIFAKQAQGYLQQRWLESI